VEADVEFEFLPCPTCREITIVEIPPCPDAHGAACPDRACTVCGTALSVDGIIDVVDGLVEVATAAPGPRSRLHRSAGSSRSSSRSGRSVA
jgi:hypothetical protein